MDDKRRAAVRRLIERSTRTIENERAQMQPDRREQVAKQCDAVVHLCKALIELHEHRAIMLRAGDADGFVDMTGRRTAYLMEMLGDVLNGMDAATEEDDWMEPVFKEAQRLWPQAAR